MMADCVNSSPRLTSLKFLESWGDLGELGGIQGNSGKLRGIQCRFAWHQSSLHMNSEGVPDGFGARPVS